MVGSYDVNATSIHITDTAASEVVDAEHLGLLLLICSRSLDTSSNLLVEEDTVEIHLYIVGSASKDTQDVIL